MRTFLDLRCTSRVISVDADGHLPGFKPQRPSDNDVASFMNCGADLGLSSGEQLGAGVGEFDVAPGFVPPQPALRDRALDGGAVFGRTASAALAISISFRTAASGSLNGLGSANFTGFVLGCDVRDMDQSVTRR